MTEQKKQKSHNHAWGRFFYTPLLAANRLSIKISIKDTKDLNKIINKLELIYIHTQSEVKVGLQL